MLETSYIVEIKAKVIRKLRTCKNIGISFYTDQVFLRKKESFRTLHFMGSWVLAPEKVTFQDLYFFVAALDLTLQ